MAFTVILHIANEDAVVGEVENLPTPSDNLIVVNNPRLRDGKDLRYLQSNVMTVIWPMHRLNFIEVLPSEQQEEVIGFVRE